MSSTAVTAYRAVLWLLPADARSAYGAQMVAMFSDAWRDLSGLSRVRFVARALVDLLVQAVVLRIAPGRGGWSSAALVVVLSDLGKDIALAGRALSRDPGFTAIVVLTLTLGIGVNSAMFSFVNGLLIRPLPYEEPDRLVQLSETAQDFGTMDLSLPDFALWRAETNVFDGIFAFDDTRLLLAGPDVSESVEGAVVSPSFMRVLGVDPALGRAFASAEERPGADGVVLISHRLWEARFGRDPAVVGSSIALNGRARSVVGVAPVDFHFPEVADVWVPLAFDPEEADPFDYAYDAIGRLAPEASIEQARAEGDRIADLLEASHPGTKSGLGTSVYPLRYADVPGGLAAAGLLALLAVALVLLVACTNVASLLLARGHQRQHEIRTRHALGAGGLRLARSALVECGLLALMGCSGALVAAAASEGLFDRMLPAERPFWLRFGLDGRVVAWTLAVGVFSCLAIGAAPALQAIRFGPSSGGAMFGRRVIGRASRGLVAGQVAVAAALVVAAGLALRSLGSMTRADPGLDPRGVLVQDVVLPPWEYPTERQRAEGARRALATAGTVPGVRSAAIVETVPFIGTGVEVSLEPEGSAAVALPVGVLNPIGGPYFRTLGIPIESGRPPTPTEERNGVPVAVVSRGLADRLWPGENPLGRRLRHSRPGARSPTIEAGEPWLTVVGVVGDVRNEGPGRSSRWALYVPWERAPGSRVTLVIKSDQEPLALAAPIREAVAEANPGVAFSEPSTIEAALGYSVWTERLASRLVGGFAALALVLAVLGVHGVVAHATRRRQREIGVRLALGASSVAIRGRVTMETLGLVGPGVAVGLSAGVGASLVASSYVPWLRPVDAPAVAVTAALLLGSGVLAGYLPARSIARTDPTAALRAD
jgi:putative ABC transport system permease protein